MALARHKNGFFASPEQFSSAENTELRLFSLRRQYWYVAIEVNFLPNFKLLTTHSYLVIF